MRHDPIVNEMHLLKMYYDSRLAVIHEWSGDWDTDVAALNQQVTEYAERAGIPAPSYLEVRDDSIAAS